MTRITDTLNDLCILIVEDDYLLAGLVRDLIELYGGTVAGPAASAEEALAIADQAAVDCVILDVKLRSGPCFSLAEELMRRELPVVFTTGYPVSAIPDRFQHLPMFIKPFDLEKLVACVADSCRHLPDAPPLPPTLVA